MKIYKLTAVALSFFCLFAFSSCVKTETDENTTVSQETQTGYTLDTVSEYTEPVTEPVTVFVTEPVTEVPATEAAVTEAMSTEEVTTQAADKGDDVSSWGSELVAAYYKNAAVSTGNSVKSSQTIELKDISVNNGALSGMFKYVTPVLSKFLSGSASETDGITGNFNALSPEDIASADAYKENGLTVIEMTLKEQSCKASESSSDGSVGHAISVVGDLGSIINKLNEAGLPLEVNSDNAVITYRNAVVKVLIDDSGKIVKGTWSCEVEIKLSNYKFAGAAVDSTVVVLQNTITTGGGFNG